jgi:hypothetical protein
MNIRSLEKVKKKLLILVLLLNSLITQLLIILKFTSLHLVYSLHLTGVIGSEGFDNLTGIDL